MSINLFVAFWSKRLKDLISFASVRRKECHVSLIDVNLFQLDKYKLRYYLFEPL
jgi:hypothetical protein